MIPYVEIIGKYSLKSFAIVEPSQCWFELSYYDIGQFEVYARATPSNVSALKNGNYVKLPNRDYLWVIKSVEYKFSADGAKMIDAKGYEAKWLLNNRVIASPMALPTDLGRAVYTLVDSQMGSTASDSRRVNGFVTDNGTGAFGSIEDTQATRGNLWSFVQALAKANHLGTQTRIADGYIHFSLAKGKDRTEEVIFSQSLDNLISADYYESSTNKKTYCLVVSSFTENNTTTDYVNDYDQGTTGIDRLETIATPNISTKYKDADGTEKETTPDSDLYKGWQWEEGRNTLADKTISRTFSGDIDLEHSRYVFDTDFTIGDLVSIIDETIGYKVKARISKYTFKQDSKGYGEEADYLTVDEATTPTDSSAYVLTEQTAVPVLTENNALLIQEESQAPRVYNSRKISELKEASSVNADDKLVVAQAGETKAMTFGTLTKDLATKDDLPTAISADDLNDILV